MIELSNIEISLIMMKEITEIDEFKVNWNVRNLTRLDQLKELKRVSTIESIGSSNRIEGNKLSNLDVETVLKNIKKPFKLIKVLLLN